MAYVPVLSVLTGKVAPFRAADEPSAIAKQAVAGPVTVGWHGLAGDEQADRVHHGGADKAIHHYPADHYPFWRGELAEHPLLAFAGAFGENISTHGLTEDAACIGDRFRLGTALVEVSQGRQPCWKLEHRFGQTGIVAKVIRTRRAGWYYRVMETGLVAAGDSLELLERPLPQWTISRCIDLLLGGAGKREQQALRDLSTLEVLADPWRIRAAELLA